MIAIHFATHRVLRYSNDISIRKTKALQKIWQNVFQNVIQNVFQKVNMQSVKRINQSASGRELRHLLVISLFTCSSYVSGPWSPMEIIDTLRSLADDVENNRVEDTKQYIECVFWEIG